MSFLLDTNIVSEYLRRPSALLHRFIQYSGRLYLPTLSLAELYVSAYVRDNPDPTLRAIESLIRDEVEIIEFDADCASIFGMVRADQLRSGTLSPVVDLMVASVALAYDLTLVTHNVTDFFRVPGLRVIDWLSP
jgi:tRNA(fMet)-specific endonuclease VapC